MTPRRTTEHDIPEHILQWLDSNKRESYESNLHGVLTEFGDHLLAKTFMKNDDLADVCVKQMEVAYRKGRHTKMFSKKMCAKIDGQILLKHFPLKKTAVFTEIVAKSHKKIGYNFSIVNYFESKGGYIYAFRPGVPFPPVFFFTAHFFDRLLTRGFGNHDHHARMTGVLRLLRYLDRRLGEGGSYVYSYPKTNQSFLAALGGMALGVNHYFEHIHEAFGFPTDGFKAKDPKALLVPEIRDVFLFLTYLDKAKLGPEQLYLYNRLLPPPRSA